MDKEILDKLYLKAINFCSYSPRSKKEILDKLDRYILKEQVNEDEKDDYIEKVSEILEGDGYINDEKLARDFVESNVLSSKPRSRVQIKNKLYKKKIPAEIIDTILSEISPEDEAGSATKVLEKKVKNRVDNLSIMERQKLIKFLLSKGFSYSSSKSAVDTMFDVK